MDNLRLDLRFAIRALRKSPGFAGAAILTLALGIGANTAIFSVVHGVLLESLPFDEPDRLVIVWETDAHNESFRENASAPDYLDFKAQSTSFDGLAAYQALGLSLTEPDGEPRRVSAAAVSRDLFRVMGRTPALGRGFAEEDDRIGATPVAVLSHALWVERYGADPNVLGRRVTLESMEHTIVGVMPPGLDFPGGVELWIALAPAIEPVIDTRGVHNLTVIGRLAEGRSLEEAGSEMSTIAARLEQEYPGDNIGRGVRLEPLHEAVVGRVRPALWILLAAVGLVLLIACANVASLLLARASARTREVAVRTALGAGRGRLVRQLLTESVVIGLAGGALGVLLAFWAVDALRALAPPGLPRLESVGLDAPVLLFALAVSLFCGILFGLVPAWHATGPRLAESLQEGSGRAGTGRVRRRARSALVVSEVALAVVLTIGAGLLIKSFWRLTHVDPGFDPDGVLVVGITLPQSAYPFDRSVYPEWPEVQQFVDRAAERVTAVPGVLSVGIAANHPLQSGWTSQVQIVGRPERDGPRDEVRIRAATPGYFGTVSIPLIRGRTLDERDRTGAPDVLLVNEAFVRRYFPDEDAIGRSVTFWGRPREIVGIVGDVRFRGLDRPPEPALYPPLQQVPLGFFSVLVRTVGDPKQLIRPVQDAIWSVDPELAFFGVRTLEAARQASIGEPRFQMMLVTLFGALALALAAIGVYGVIAYQVQQRTREIGVRIALGASRRRVIGGVLGEGMTLAAAGVALGLLFAWAGLRLISGLLFDTPALDPAMYAAVAGLLIVVALGASLLPARRAARIDPMEALRYE